MLDTDIVLQRKYTYGIVYEVGTKNVIPLGKKEGKSTA